VSVAVAEHENARRARQVAEAVARGDVEAALQHFPNDVVWFSPSPGPQNRVYRGRDGLVQFFGRLQERADGTFRAEVVDVLGSDTHVVMFLRVTASRGDRQLDVLVAHFATVGAGRFTRNWFLPSDVSAWNRFFT
jgi:ketosteroid isomerase-like protein